MGHVKKKQSFYFRSLLLLAMLVFFTGCEQKEQTVEESPAVTDERSMEVPPVSADEASIEETPLPVEMMDNQLFYAEGMESISVNEAKLMKGKEVDMTVQTAEEWEIYCRIGREEMNPQMKLQVIPIGESEIAGIDLVDGFLGKGFLEDYYPTARSGFDYQMAWYDFHQDGKKELIFAGGDKQETLVCSVFQFEVIEENVDGQSRYLEPKTILEIPEGVGVRAYVNDHNEICVVDGEGHISKVAVPL